MVVDLVLDRRRSKQSAPIKTFNLTLFSKNRLFPTEFFALLSKKRKCHMRFFNIQTGQSESEKSEKSKLEHPSGKLTRL